MQALGFAEIPIISITASITDRVVKAVRVHLPGLETIGNESLMLGLQRILVASSSSLALKGLARSGHRTLYPVPLLEAWQLIKGKLSRETSDRITSNCTSQLDTGQPCS